MIRNGLALLLLACAMPAQDKLQIPKGLPIHATELVRNHPRRPHGQGFPNTIRNRLSIAQVRRAIRQGAQVNGLPHHLEINLGHIKQTLDGMPLDPARIYGTVVIGPYPFEAKEARFPYPRWRLQTAVDKGISRVDAAALFTGNLNSEDWTNHGQLAVRLRLKQQESGRDLDLGTYDTFVWVERNGAEIKVVPSIVEGPLVNLVTSDDPTRCVITLVTSEPISAGIVLDTGDSFRSPKANVRHDIQLTGLEPNREYEYSVTVGSLTTRKYRLRTAPAKGSSGFRFAYGGDSRQGPGFGLESHMGCNYADLHRLTQVAYARGARFLLQGGDLVNGYTTSPDDYRTQLYGWKYAVMGFAAERPVYPVLGNHECLIYNFDDGTTYGISVDRWPYATESSEAIFADELVLPTNGPKRSNPKLPPYRETAYSFQYGSVLCIAVNNNYWISYASDLFGGSPEGYVMRDQIDWLKAELDRAAADSTIRYVFIYMQEPVLPNGGHIQDAMWYLGDNRVRAHIFDGKRVVPMKEGIIDVRNEMMLAIHANAKVIAVLGSDEHAYSRLLVDNKVPLGVPATDDKNKDGVINWHDADVNGDGKPDAHESASPLPLGHPIWYFIGGGLGAPFYAREKTPWNEHWSKRADGATFFRYSSQPNIMLFDVTDDGVAISVVNHYGELIEHIPNLTVFPKR
ncbi:MAG: hypothetical protein CMJ85_07520 [Planctomycetes bacterium]|jgi:hypothetical protein|nr:hypothetical protein [Planctomycetota bacterium]MDP6423822.1 metallophosphoesterase [Planctomycetota bacterium]